jgi:hypothetical protein
MTRSMYSALALVTLAGSISATTIFEQTQHNCHVLATDYKNATDTVLVGSWKASDFYKYGMNPITITVTNNGTEDILIDGANVRNSNQAGIVDNVLLKPWHNRVLYYGLELGTALPGLYVGLNQCVRGVQSLKHTSGIFKTLLGGFIVAHSASVTTALLSGLYIARSLHPLEGVALMGTILISQAAKLVWLESFDKEFRRQVLLSSDKLRIKPGESISKIIIVTSAYPVLNLPLTDLTGKTHTVAVRLQA